MLLTSIEIQNYRSLFGDKHNQNHLLLNLADGMNSIVGPNNVGKSNIFRALAIAFESGRTFDRRKDAPPLARNVKPTVTLTFKLPDRGRSSSENTLARYLEEYERAVNPSARRTNVAAGEVKFRVIMEGGSDSPGVLNQHFVAAGAGGRFLKDDNELLVKALKQFKRCVHFVYIESGQSLTSLLEGKFRDILKSVLKEHLAAEFTTTEQAREVYVSSIRQQLLDPLTTRIAAELKELVPEISGVTLQPYVGTLEETLTKMGVSVSDAALTDLAEKGTGVRGGVLVAMLRHLADEGRRSMIFAVEEPEAFLHPAAQECMRDDLEAIALKPNVSLLVSTHSPFVVSREASSRVFSLAKEANGRTVLAASADGNEPHAPALGALFRGRLVMDVLDRAQHIPATAKAILVVEGYTDRRYIESAARLLGEEGFLSEVAIVEAGHGLAQGVGGASLAVMQALVARATSHLPVIALFDNDVEGCDAFNQLAKIASKNKEWVKGKNLLQYCHVIPNGASVQFAWEAEDLWPNELFDAYLSDAGEAGVLSEKCARPKPLEGWHYGLKAPAKAEFADFLDGRATAADCALWVNLISMVRAQY